MKLDAIGLFVTDIGKAVTFYRDILGMETDWDDKAPNVELESGGFHLTLFSRSDFEKETGQIYAYPTGINGTFELGFEVENYAAVDLEYKRITELGATAVMPPTTNVKWKERTCLVADPDGNLIEIGSLIRN